MALRVILKGEDPALRRVCKPVREVNRRTLQLLDDMYETMQKAEGVGIAASQVGILRRAVVIDTGEGRIDLINPEILLTEGSEGQMEGCLSFPGESGYVERPAHVVARALDRNGNMKEYDATGLFARAIMHEVDHLDGKLYVDLVTDPPADFQMDEDEEDE